MELVKFGTEVALEMEDRREDDYEANKVRSSNATFPKKLLAKTSFPSIHGQWKQIRFV